jgi:hypothetical protein
MHTHIQASYEMSMHTVELRGNTYWLRQLANGKAEQTAELGIKEASFQAWDSFTAHYRSTHQERDNQLQHIKKEETMPDDALRTWHYTAQPSMLLAALRPAPAPAMSCYNSPWPSGRPDASSLHSSPALCHSQHCWGEPSSDTKLNMAF